MFTDYHAKVWAHELTRRAPSDSIDKLASAVAGAQVDLNPHQVDAALFAFRSPLSKGALLADEVGLGKTIEAGLVLSQRWAEHKRRILIITPANLRKQWLQELGEKFFLPGLILEARSYKAAFRSGLPPFEPKDSIVLCSYQFACGKADDVARVPWDLVVVDEAHRLRNVYKPGNMMANTLKTALRGRQKLLLTATPLQNSLLELYGLISFIDEIAFGDAKSFREQFTSLTESTFNTLKQRIAPLCHRTLRRQVTAYIPYTRRHAILEEFTPDQAEDDLYDLVSDYLRRPNLQALPSGQRTLMTLVLRKLLASSSFAIAGALQTISARLRERLREAGSAPVANLSLEQDYEALPEIREEWADEDAAEALSDDDRAALKQEITDLDHFAALATAIESNSKGRSLLRALAIAFAKAEQLGSARKAIIFTESRRTQDYLLRLLADSNFADGIVLFNGSNNDKRSRAVYTEWLAQHAGSDRVTGSRTADMRSALVDYFRDTGKIMIATEAGAEGINLQFCSLVVNYDLPWNPQRIEQRIGRCHRYGQKHDVVVVNFLNRNNAADRRVYELLAEKFRLFEGVFGASDEVLGAIESGVDFEKRISTIYQQCRKPDEIARAFDQLQLELGFEIDQAMTRTRQQLLEHFDEEVREKLRVRDADSREVLGRVEQTLMRLTRHELGILARFDGDGSFELDHVPPELPSGIGTGRYELPRRSGQAHTYRMAHPLAELLINRASLRNLAPAGISFDLDAHPGKIGILEPLRGQSGQLQISLLSIDALGQVEDHLIFAAIADNGESLIEDAARRLFSLPGAITAPQVTLDERGLAEATERRRQEIQRDIGERNARFFGDESEKLDGWADDLKAGLEREIKDVDRQIREVKRAAAVELTLEGKLVRQREQRELEQNRMRMRRGLFERQDEIDAERDRLIRSTEARLQQSSQEAVLLRVRWKLV